MTTARVERASAAFTKQQDAQKHGSYSVAGEAMSVNDKLAILEARGQSELVEIFKDWRPRVSNRRKRGAPLDQRVSITVSSNDRLALDGEMKAIKASGDKTTLGALIRNRAMGNVDIVGWGEIATKALDELDLIASTQGELKAKKRTLEANIETEDDEEQVALYNIEIADISRKLEKIVARSEKRNNRLQGRMSMPEAETVKWRAQRLCISTSDYLRMMIFDLEPNSNADAHMSLDAKRRFYVSILEVAKNGWGTPPTIYECSQCETYMDELLALRQHIKTLENFS